LVVSTEPGTPRWVKGADGISQSLPLGLINWDTDVSCARDLSDFGLSSASEDQL